MKQIRVLKYRSSEIVKYWKETAALQHSNTPLLLYFQGDNG